jgi:integration host factor subunit alpha
MTVTRLDLTRHLSDTVGLTAIDCAALVDSFFDTILRTTLAAGEDVKLSGFGYFTLHEKRARPGRNPKNGEPFEIRARRVVTFRASQLIKVRCDDLPQLPPFGKARALAGD